MSNRSLAVIVPMRNAGRYVEQLASSLAALRSPDGWSVRILIVNDASNDGSAELLRARGLEVVSIAGPVGSYSARNFGLALVDADVLAFTDADCSPDADWLVAAVNELEEHDADVVAGRVVFQTKGAPTGAEVWDMYMNMRNDLAVERGEGKTANLVACRSAFDRYGPFPEGWQSGGDVAWTRAVSRGGGRLIYCHHAIVRHPARCLSELVRKQWRVGGGMGRIGPVGRRASLQLLVPPRPGSISRAVQYADSSPSATALVRVFLAAWSARAATGLAVLWCEGWARG